MATRATTDFLKWTLALVGLGVMAVGLMLWLMSGSTGPPVPIKAQGPARTAEPRAGQGSATERASVQTSPEESPLVAEDYPAAPAPSDAQPAVRSVAQEPQSPSDTHLRPIIVDDTQADAQTSGSEQTPAPVPRPPQDASDSSLASAADSQERPADDRSADLVPEPPSPAVTMMPPPSPPASAEPLPTDPVALRAQLHQAIKDHRVLNYRELWEALSYTDQDPDRPGYVILFYTGWSRSAQKNGGDPDEWNREHIWVKSRGDFGTRPGPGTDLHHIRATDVSVNGARGNLSFDDGGRLYRDGDGPTRCRRDDDSWEPDDPVKGDVARMMFYVDVRYEAGLDLELVDAIQAPNDKAPVHGKLSTLLRWHELDPVDEAERRRNDRVEELQGNRNPFIDQPELVERLWPRR